VRLSLEEAQGFGFRRCDPSAVEVTSGASKEIPNILSTATSPLSEASDCRRGKKKKVAVAGVCTDPFFHLTVLHRHQLRSQEIPPMTGAVDLIVAGIRCVNPSLVELAGAAKWRSSQQRCSRVKPLLISPARWWDGQEAFEARRNVARNIPGSRSRSMGFSARTSMPRRLRRSQQQKDQGVLLLADATM